MATAAGPGARILLLTALAMTAFAANSILCRLALAGGAIDAAGFSAVRLLSGAVALALIQIARQRSLRIGGSWTSAAMLFLYAVPFSFAYLRLSAGTGALILFGAVQATMLSAALVAGERPPPRQWTGLALSLAGLVYLVLPGLTAPPLGASLLMGLAGVGWGYYSLRGRRTGDPLVETASNFVRSLPLAGLLVLAAAAHLHATPDGLLLAVLSGALASGAGYAVWYAALGGLTATRAAIVQLSVPLLAAAGGVLWLSETVTLRLALAAVAILGGVALAVTGRRTARAPAAAR